MSYNKKMFHEVCEFLGTNLDSKPCKMLQVHLKKCRDCEIFVDKIKKTVEIYKKADKCNSLPKNVSKRLYAFLDLKNPDESIKNYLYGNFMIEKTTQIEDIVNEHPELVKPLMEFGIVCIACGEPVWGTLEDQIKEKGINNIDDVIEQLNKLIKK